MQAAAPRRPFPLRLAGVALALVASAPFGFALSSCAAEDFSAPIPDEPITPQEFDQGATAVQQITLGGPDPAFDNGHATDETDGDTLGLAPSISEPTAQETARDLALLDQAPTSAAPGDAIDPARLAETPEAEDEPATPDPVGGIATVTSELRQCRAATGYVNGRAHRICVTTVDGKLVGMRTARAFVRMRAAARQRGISIHVVSGFRTMAQQRYLYHLYVTGRGNLAARPGYSNHQSGIALDLNTASPGVYRWLANNGARFGFRRTVPSEAWHWEYRP
jgi:hypothetical protein